MSWVSKPRKIPCGFFSARVDTCREEFFWVCTLHVAPRYVLDTTITGDAAFTGAVESVHIFGFDHDGVVHYCSQPYGAFECQSSTLGRERAGLSLDIGYVSDRFQTSVMSDAQSMSQCV